MILPAWLRWRRPRSITLERRHYLALGCVLLYPRYSWSLAYWWLRLRAGDLTQDEIWRHIT